MENDPDNYNRLCAIIEEDFHRKAIIYVLGTFKEQGATWEEFFGNTNWHSEYQCIHLHI